MIKRRRKTAALLSTLGLVLAAAALALDSGAPAAAGRPRTATIVYTGSIRGALEPCGCTSDPLGDVSRLTGVVRRAGSPKNVLLVDAGDLIYPREVPKNRVEGADLRAEFLATELSRLPFGGAAIGAADLAAGADKVEPHRLAANWQGVPFLEPSRIREVGGIRIGILGLADPALAQRFGGKAEPPAEAAQREATRLRKEGAEIVLGLAALDRATARLVARTGALDILVIGKDVGDGLPRADRVASGPRPTYVVAAAEEMQRIGRIDLTLFDQDKASIQLVDAGGPEARAAERAAVKEQLAKLEADLARWAQDEGADPAFLAARRKERATLAARLSALQKAWQPPTSGASFTNRLIPLSRALPRDPALAKAMRRLDAKVGAANLRRAEPPPKAPPGRGVFVGDGACAKCHEEAMAFWRKTVHAQAWKTIVVGGKTGFDDCVSCHVTGFGEIGGSSLGHVKGLTAVQCESCHGPGSIHVAEEGLEDPVAVRLETPESLCTTCHNQKHSDTFEYAAYLRDVLGAGHGPKAREKLGPGPTGRELRRAAVAKAKAAGKAQLRSM